MFNPQPFFYTPPKDPGIHWFRFNPADYNTTYLIVKNLNFGKTTSMRDGHVIIEFYDNAEFIRFFTKLPLHVLTPDDIETPPTDKQLRLQKHGYVIQTILIILQVVGFVGTMIYFFYCLIFGFPD